MKRLWFYTFITIAATLFFQIGCAFTSTATDETEHPRKTADTAAAIKSAEGLFSQRMDIVKLREAVKTLSGARNPESRNFEVEWKYAMYCYYLGRQTDDDKPKMKAFEDGEKAAGIAARLSPEKPDGHFWYGANLGELARLSPLTVGLTRLDEVRGAMKRVIEIEPGYQQASAFDALGRIELETSLMGGNAEKAVEYLEKGIDLGPENSNIRLNLAKAYLAADRPGDARKQLNHILGMKPNPGFEFEYNENAAAAKKLLKNKF